MAKPAKELVKNSYPLCKNKFDNRSKNTSLDLFKNNLNNNLDKDNRNSTKDYILLHRKDEIELTFDVKKGNSKANDGDGYVKAFISPLKKRDQHSRGRYF